MTTKRVVLFSSISGLNIDNCCEHLRSYADGVARSPLPDVVKVDDFLVPESEDLILKIRARPGTGEFEFTDFLRLPLESMVTGCHRAAQKAFGESKRFLDQRDLKTGIMAYHPVFYNQSTEAFAEPYHSGMLLDACRSADLSVSAIVSIHDDIYDIYRRLMRPSTADKPHGMFNPDMARGGKRRYLRDIEDLRLILDWRDRELTNARSLAASLSCRHFLFSKKGRIDSLWEAVFEGRPHVYFSHPISQPRRDITNKPKEPKCLTTDPDRGFRFIEDCKVASDSLSEYVSLVEPTCIDEGRIDHDLLQTLNAERLQSSILPPLTRRWTLGDAKMLGGAIPNEDEVSLLPVPENYFQKLSSEDEPSPSFFASAVLLLEREIFRQINLRDHKLAEQADFIFAFRPFTLPDHPDPTGGVKEEILTVVRGLEGANDVCRILIYHPDSDERRRRVNALRVAWPRLEREYLSGNSKDRLQVLLTMLIDSIDSIPLDADVGRFTTEVKSILGDQSIIVRSLGIGGSMDGAALARLQDSTEVFLSELISSHYVLKSPLHIVADSFPDTIKFINEIPKNGLGPLIRDYVDSLSPKVLEGKSG